MKEIVLSNAFGEQISKKLADFLEAERISRGGEFVIEFNNMNGKGVIRNSAFNWGVTLFSFEVQFKKEIHLKSIINNTSPLDFLFLTQGNVDFMDTENTTLKSYQNIVIHYKPHSAGTLVFRRNETIHLNLIRILPKEYLKKKNHNTSFLKESLHDIFNGRKHETIYKHFGNFNLQIADKIHQLNNIPHNGIIRTLIIEGYVNIILGLQILEHENYLNKITLPESLSENDIQKIQNACEIIDNTIADSISVSGLAKKVNLLPAKMQLGFKLLHSMTVHEYIREIKLRKAREYLKNTDLSVSEVVYNIGYKNRSYFSRIFSERFGILPTEYRKKIK